jgi:hypothetical protein
MPPKKVVKKVVTVTPATAPLRISCGSGITAGLEMWRVGPTIVLYDRSPDGRFADDVESWNTAAGLNAACALLLKDAAGKDTA